MDEQPVARPDDPQPEPPSLEPQPGSASNSPAIPSVRTRSITSSACSPISRRSTATALFGDDPAIVAGMALLRRPPGHDGRPAEGPRHQAEAASAISACRSRKAIARPCGRCSSPPSSAGPIVTFLDTPGAYPGIDAEERGQAEAIACNLREMSRLAVPVICVCHRRRRQRRRAGAGRRQSRLHDGERRLQRDLAGKLRRHHLPRLPRAPKKPPPRSSSPRRICCSSG